MADAEGDDPGHDGIPAAAAAAVHAAHEDGVVQDAEDSCLSSSSVDAYAGFLQKYADFCATYLNDEGERSFTNQVMQPPVEPVLGEPWRHYNKQYKKQHPCWRFEKNPCQVDWRNFDVEIFKRWMLHHQRTPKPNGKYPSWKKNMKATSAVKWGFKHAHALTNGVLSNQDPPANLDAAMKAVKKVCHKFFATMDAAMASPQAHPWPACMTRGAERWALDHDEDIALDVLRVHAREVLKKRGVAVVATKITGYFPEVVD